LKASHIRIEHSFVYSFKLSKASWQWDYPRGTLGTGM